MSVCFFPLDTALVSCCYAVFGSFLCQHTQSAKQIQEEFDQNLSMITSAQSTLEASVESLLAAMETTQDAIDWHPKDFAVIGTIRHPLDVFHLVPFSRISKLVQFGTYSTSCVKIFFFCSLFCPCLLFFFFSFFPVGFFLSKSEWIFFFICYLLCGTYIFIDADTHLQTISVAVDELWVPRIVPPDWSGTRAEYVHFVLEDLQDISFILF